MRYLILFVYIVAAGWAAWSQRESAWFVLHAVGAISGVCALWLAISYAGALGEFDEDAPDQARDYMEREDWDD
jgi:hypothetical protein